MRVAADDETVARIRRVADPQAGNIHRRQLLALGLDHHAIRRLCTRGWLVRIYRSVYRVGHGAPVALARETAAAMSCGPACRLAGGSALVVWGVLKDDGTVPVEVDAVGADIRRTGIAVRFRRELASIDARRHRKLPVVSPALALLEFAATARADQLERAVREAIALKLVDRPGLLAVIARYPGQRGTRRLRDVADPDLASQITKSEAEERFAALLKKADAPPSRAQFRIGRYLADRCWPELRLVVEIDGVRFHSDGQRMKQDNRRTDALRALGYTVVRFTRGQIVHDPEYVLLTLGRALGAAEAARAAR